MLPERIFDLALEAWFDDLPAILLMEMFQGFEMRPWPRNAPKD